MPDRGCEVAVVGAGVVGMATTKALLSAGIDVKCFERGAHGSGQSAGATRLFRHTHDSTALVSLAVAARTAWAGWEDELGRALIGDEGVLRFGPDLDSAAHLLSAAAVRFEFLDPIGQTAALPGLISPAERALFEHTGGAIRARRTVDFLKGIIEPVFMQAEVLALEARRRGAYRLLTPDGLWDCQRVVLCAGAETARLAAQLGIEIPLLLRLHPRVTFAVRETASGSQLACLQDRSGNHGESVYGSPLGRSGEYAVGLLGPTSETPCEASRGAPARSLAAGSLIARIANYVDVAMKGLDPRPVAVRICPTTTLEQGQDAFHVWSERGLTAIGGTNLFKFAPILGELLAETILSERVPEPLLTAVSRS